MADNSKVAKALERLNSAIEGLETIVDERLEREVALGDAQTEVQRMGADRNRLAGSLDQAEARALRLEGANKEVSRRLVDAMETIRSVLDKQSGKIT